MKLTKISKERAFQKSLPKWPQMLVTGESIEVNQAKEIIFATDSSLSTYGPHGNDRRFREWFMEITGFNLLLPDNLWEGAYDEKRTIEERQSIMQRAHKHNKAVEAFSESFDRLGTRYVVNDWVSSAFIGGPHGWCHPDGTIEYSDNIGKWPGVEEVYEEWCVIAERWPFLTLYVTLMSGESCEYDTSSPVVTFKVSDGQVEIYEGTLCPHKIDGKSNLDDDSFSHLLHALRFDDYSREQGVPREWVVEFAQKVRPIVDDVLQKFELLS